MSGPISCPCTAGAVNWHVLAAGSVGQRQSSLGHGHEHVDMSIQCQPHQEVHSHRHMLSAALADTKEAILLLVCRCDFLLEFNITAVRVVADITRLAALASQTLAMTGVPRPVAVAMVRGAR